MTLLFFDSAPEIMFILVVALIIFGPRKLPELSRSLGKSLGEFKRASDEFKRTWEREVSLEHESREQRVGEAMLPPAETSAAATGTNMLASSNSTDALGGDAYDNNTIARDAGRVTQPVETPAPTTDANNAVAPAPQSPHKADWL
jgi:TatA/E family protein of Tat protein translocase